MTADFLEELNAETEAGRLEKMNGAPLLSGPLVSGSWRGRPPVREHSTSIRDFEAQWYDDFTVGGVLPGTLKPARAPLPMNTETLIKACDNHARAESEPHSLDFAVTFRVLLNGEYQGQWCGNRFGWRFLS